MRNVFFFLLITVSFNVFSQETTTGDVSNSNNSNKGNVLIIPFEPKLYISDIDIAKITHNCY